MAIGKTPCRRAYCRLGCFFAGCVLAALSLVAISFHLSYALNQKVKFDQINRSTLTQTEPFAHAKPLDNSKVAVFYNLYAAPKDPAGLKRARRIAREQFAALGDSSLTRDGPVSVYINMIGQPINVTTECQNNNLDCTVMHAYAPGHYEDVTLTEMHNFCRQYPTHKVIYLHSKGSYHPVETPILSQSAWRQNMVQAVVHDDCLSATECDVCGLVALPFPALHFSGNFFTAQCEYISKLLPPTEFRIAMRGINARGFLKRLSFQIVAAIMDDAPYHYAVGRWASEHWLGSHPDVRACDMSPRPLITYWQKEKISDEAEFQFAPFPRHKVTDSWEYVGPKSLKATQTDAQRKREWFFLAGTFVCFL
jgi:hypothetical protein